MPAVTPIGPDGRRQLHAVLRDGIATRISPDELLSGLSRELPNTIDETTRRPPANRRRAIALGVTLSRARCARLRMLMMLHHHELVNQHFERHPKGTDRQSADSECRGSLKASLQRRECAFAPVNDWMINTR
jgi:hypothetical protein